MTGIRRPPAPLLYGFRWFLAAAGFAVVWVVGSAARPEADNLAAVLADIRPVTRSMAPVEASWVRGTFEPQYLPSPPGPEPCTESLPTVPASLRAEMGRRVRGAGPEPQRRAAEIEELAGAHSGSWLPPLAAANLYLRAGDLASAERVLDRYLGSSSGSQLVGRMTAAHGEGPAPRLEEVLAAIHLLQSSAYVQIERSTVAEARLWRDLKNPIGYVRLLGRRGMLSAGSARAADAPWQSVVLPSPGCQPTSNSLTSGDLYNNLIVGYLRVPGFRETEERRNREFFRDYDAPPATNPALATLQRVIREWRPEREAWVWALSNAERVLRDLPWWSEPGDIDVKPWLALNLAQLLEAASSEAPESAREALLAQVHILTEVALRKRAEVGEAQKAAFNPAMARMALLDAVRSGDPEPLPKTVLADLSEEQQEVARAVMAAVAARAEPGRWLALAIGEDDAHLASGDAAWRRAAREDLATTLARRGIGVEEVERRSWAGRARSVLRLGDEVPPELTAVEADLGFAWKIPLYARSVLTHPVVGLLVALATGALAFLVGRYLGEELRRRRALFTSFYRLEWEERRR